MPGQPFALRYADKEYACGHRGIRFPFSPAPFARIRRSWHSQRIWEAKVSRGGTRGGKKVGRAARLDN